jgi:hypothetical protein
MASNSAWGAAMPAKKRKLSSKAWVQISTQQGRVGIRVSKYQSIASKQNVFATHAGCPTLVTHLFL